MGRYERKIMYNSLIKNNHWVVTVVVLLVKSFFSPKVAKELLYRAKKKHGVKIIQNKTNIDNLLKH